MDVSVNDDVFIKKASLPFEQTQWMTTLALLLLIAPLLKILGSTVEHRPSIGPHRAHFRPPLRGPPVTR
jgi:hypothetical protein